ncbi:hypothetical protein ACG0XA_14390, partial [Klebsiella pneumoniae]
ILDNEVDEVSLLVDSRSPLCHYDYLVLAAAKSRKRKIIVLDSIPYSTPEDLKYIKESLVSINGYYRYDALDVAFRIIAKDQIVIVDPDTGKALPKVPKTDDNGKIILINGKPVMVDDPDGYNPVILKRLPEVTIFD